MKNRILFLLIGSFVLLQNNYSQTLQDKDTLYFNANWKKTNRTNHKFYRLLPLKTVGNLSLIQDFYKNGNMQMQAYAYTNNLKNLVGDIHWYDKNGFDRRYEMSYNPTNQPLTFYHNNGKVWKTITYKNAIKEGNIKVFNKKGKHTFSKNFKNGFVSNNIVGKFDKGYGNYENNSTKKVKKTKQPELKNVTRNLYWLENKKLAKVTKYVNGTITEELSYSKKGKLLQHLKENDFFNNKFLDGNLYKYKTTNGFAVALDSVTYRGQKSKVINLSNIKSLKANINGKLDFFKEGENETSKLIYKLHYNDDVPVKSFMITGKPSNVADAINSSDIIIDVDDIKTQSATDFLKIIGSKEWSNTFNYDSYLGNHKTIFKQINSELFARLDIDLSKNYDDYLTSQVKEDNETINKWRIKKAECYTINVILLNKNKPILFLSDRNNIKYYIIPTKNGLITNFNNNNNNVIEKNASNLDENVLKTFLNTRNSNLFYGVKSENKKKYITNIFDEIVVDKAYDSIYRKHQYIIGIKNGTTHIYNLKLDKLPIENIRKMYFDKHNLQVLANNKVSYIDILGNETNKQEINRDLYDQIRLTYFEINFEIVKLKINDNTNAIKITTGYNGGNFESDYLTLNNLNKNYNLTFLNDSLKIVYDSRKVYNNKSDFVDTSIKRMNMLVVAKNNKVGLYNFDDEYEDETNKGVPQQFFTEAKELLPIIYGNISSKGGLIIVEKDNKLGIYPLTDGLKYKSFGEVSGNFIPYETLNGEKGWLDLKTHKEFPNK